MVGVPNAPLSEVEGHERNPFLEAPIMTALIFWHRWQCLAPGALFGNNDR